MRPFNKTTATLVRPHPFSTLCPTPIGNSPVCLAPIYPNFMVVGLNYGLIYDLWPLKIGYKFYHEFLIQDVPQFVFVILTPFTHPNCRVVLQNSENLYERHKNFENQWPIFRGCKSGHILGPGP